MCGKSTFPWRTISIIWTIWINFLFEMKILNKSSETTSRLIKIYIIFQRKIYATQIQRISLFAAQFFDFRHTRFELTFLRIDGKFPFQRSIVIII